MRLVIIPEDQIVIIDGVSRQFEFEMDANYHAVQWYGNHGVIETKTGKDIKLENIDAFEDLVDTHALILQEEENSRIEFENDPQRKVEKLAAIRWQHETGGVEVDGIRYWTTRDSIPVWSRMLANAEADENFVVEAYKAMSGYVANLTAAQIIAADVVGQAHITKCYVAEMQVLADLDTVELEDIEQAFIAAYDGITL